MSVEAPHQLVENPAKFADFATSAAILARFQADGKR